MEEARAQATRVLIRHHNAGDDVAGAVELDSGRILDALRPSDFTGGDPTVAFPGQIERGLSRGLVRNSKEQAGE